MPRGRRPRSAAKRENLGGRLAAFDHKAVSLGWALYGLMCAFMGIIIGASLGGIATAEIAAFGVITIILAIASVLLIGRG